MSRARILPVTIGTLVVPMDSMVNVAFPAIVTGFGLELPQVQWVAIAYVLTYGSLMLAVGRLGDILGHLRVFRFGLAVSATGLLLCSAAPDYGSFLAFRVVQGIGAALVIGVGPALATALFPETQRLRALADYATGFAAGVAVGPLLAGVLVGAFDWPGVYWSRAPVALLALALTARISLPPPAGAREPFDLPGAALLAIAIATALLAVNRSLWLLPVALACAAGFVWRCRRVARPIIDLSVFRLPGFAGLNLANVLVQHAAFAVMLLVPFFLVRIAGASPLVLGLVLGAVAVGAMAGSSLGGWAVARWGARPMLVAAVLLSSAGLALVARWGAGTPLPALAASLAVQGLGLGLFTLAYTDVVTATMRREDRGVAGSLVQLTRTLGVVSAASLLALLFATTEAGALAAGAGAPAAFLAGFRRVFLAAALLPLLALPMLLVRRRGG